MKKNILILGLISLLGFSTVSCSTDDSDMEMMEAQADGLQSTPEGNTDSSTSPVDNGDKELPKPPMKP
ncbi:hypothetical protein GCM10007424_16160 [Flavobacterium suaedae]|uniref:Cytochrome C551 n=1 Tax=Flavobacterium suaedae TaxID=1767027 RepID=A0ABQ1JX99_9FLAO|nr:hypothetical protein [Flavobacterium suaedae]GGB76882.1 hypothetical protein GCM10007424_16160 [Flavobacterium suaedae]